MQVRTRLYLVVCAQTEADQEDVFQGPEHHRLSSEGMRQARLLSRRLSGQRIEAFYSSPYEGAMATASALAAGHRRGVLSIPELRDMDYGDWTGKSVTDLREVDPEEFTTWRFTPHRHRMPGGETLKEVQSRVVSALEQILSAEQDQGVCAVTHTIPVKTALCHFLNQDLSIIWHTEPQESTALNILEWEGDQPTVALLGSREHLEAEPA
ncbi:MAG TPA: histidine phosphatase family protein [Chloroflexi bacterium]|nr:histidine phosphatase family protein [Chloroflexota bacterium]